MADAGGAAIDDLLVVGQVLDVQGEVQVVVHAVVQRRRPARVNQGMTRGSGAAVVLQGGEAVALVDEAEAGAQAAAGRRRPMIVAGEGVEGPFRDLVAAGAVGDLVDGALVDHVDVGAAAGEAQVLERARFRPENSTPVPRRPSPSIWV